MYGTKTFCKRSVNGDFAGKESVRLDFSAFARFRGRSLFPKKLRCCFGNFADVASDIRRKRIFPLFRPLDDVIVGGGDHVRKVPFRRAPVVISRIVGSGIEDDPQHFGGV